MQRHGGLPRWLRATPLGSLFLSMALTAAVAAGSLLPAAYASAAPQPILWGAYVDGVPWNAAKLGAFEAQAGKSMSIIHFGQPWINNGADQLFPATDFQTIRDHGSIPMLAWGSWDYSRGQDQPDFRLSTIIAGAHDAYLTRWAQAARAWGHPFFLRFDWEMNGWWQFPWSEQTNGNQANEYARAWRHVHDIFIQQGATNATWVWCPNVVSPGTTALASLYPGDDYVDWTGMDGYNWGTDKGNQWQSFADVFGPGNGNDQHGTYQQLVSLAPNKPIMLGEVATSRNGGDSGAWVKDALQQQLPANFPQIKALVWFNWNAGDSNLSWPIEDSAATQTAFAQSIASEYFASNDFGGLQAGRIAPLGGLALASSPPD